MLVGSQLISGLLIGFAFALAALGLVLVYRTSGVFNFAHGAVGMYSALAYATMVRGGTPKALALLLGLALGAALGIAIQQTLRFVPSDRSLTKMMVTVAWLATLQATAQIQFPSVKSAPQLFGNARIEVAGLFISADQIFMAVVTGGLVVGLYAFLKRTRIGIAMRAVPQNPPACRLLGVSEGSVLALSWAVGGLLAALAGILLAPFVSLDTESLPFLAIVQAAAAAMVGGLQSLPLTFVGALVLGLGYGALGAIATSGAASQNIAFLRASLAFLLMLAALLFRGKRGWIRV